MMAKKPKPNKDEEANIKKTQQWSKAVDKTDKKMDDIGKEKDMSPEEKLRRLLDEE